MNSQMGIEGNGFNYWYHNNMLGPYRDWSSRSTLTDLDLVRISNWFWDLQNIRLDLDYSLQTLTFGLILIEIKFLTESSSGV